MHNKEHDIEDEKFEALLEQKRHNELKGLLIKLATAMSGKDDGAVVKAIKEQSSDVRSLVTAIQNIPKPDTPKMPDVNVQFDHKHFVSSMDEIAKRIEQSNNKVIESLENRLLPDTFTMVKAWNGSTESVKVNYKQANLIVIKK